MKKTPKKSVKPMKKSAKPMKKLEFVAPDGAVEFDPMRVVDDDGIFCAVDAGAAFPADVKAHEGKCNNCGACRPVARIGVAALGRIERSLVCAECTYDLLMGSVVLGAKITAETDNGGVAELVLSRRERERVHEQGVSMNSLIIVS